MLRSSELAGREGLASNPMIMPMISRLRQDGIFLFFEREVVAGHKSVALSELGILFQTKSLPDPGLNLQASIAILGT
jgi:hypothetical protein